MAIEGCKIHFARYKVVINASDILVIKKVLKTSSAIIIPAKLPEEI